RNFDPHVSPSHEARQRRCRIGHMLDQPPNFSPRETSVTEPAFDLRQILSFVWRQWKFAAAITALVLVVGITILMRQTPLYTATAQVLLERQREKAPGAEAILAIT